MRIADTLPAYAAALPVRKRPAPIRVERAAGIPALTRHGRTGADGATYTNRHPGGILPPHRGRFVDIYV